MPVTLTTKIEDRTHTGQATLLNRLSTFETRSRHVSYDGTIGPLTTTVYRYITASPWVYFAFTGYDPNTGSGGDFLRVGVMLKKVSPSAFFPEDYAEEVTCQARWWIYVPGFTVNWPAGVEVSGDIAKWYLDPGDYPLNITLQTEVWDSSGGRVEFITGGTVTFAGKTATLTRSGSGVDGLRSIWDGVRCERGLRDCNAPDSNVQDVQYTGYSGMHGLDGRTPVAKLYEGATLRRRIDHVGYVWSRLPAELAGVNGISWQAQGHSSGSGKNPLTFDFPTFTSHANISWNEPVSLTQSGDSVTVNYRGSTPAGKMESAPASLSFRKVYELLYNLYEAASSWSYSTYAAAAATTVQGPYRASDFAARSIALNNFTYNHDVTLHGLSLETYGQPGSKHPLYYHQQFSHSSSRLVLQDGVGGGGGENASGPWCLQDRWGRFHVATVENGIRYRRSDSYLPPFSVDTKITTLAADRSPRMIMDGDGRIHLTHYRGNTGILWRWSDDNGKTWSDPVTLWSSGTRPDVAYDPHLGCKIFAARVGGALQLRLQFRGDTQPRAAFNAKLANGTNFPLDDDSFHIVVANEESSRWVIASRQGGTVTYHYSTDSGKTWKPA